VRATGKFLLMMYGYFCIWLPLPVYVNIFLLQAFALVWPWRLAASTVLVLLILGSVRLNLWVFEKQKEQDDNEYSNKEPL
jgi:hypothetical protein